MEMLDRVFLAGCYPVPGRKYDPHDKVSTYEADQAVDALKDVRRWYGPAFEAALPGKVFCDFGCGGGFPSLQAVEKGATFAIGIDIYPEKYASSQKLARERNLPVRYVKSATEVPPDYVDIVLSQNSFEHFMDPGLVLDDVFMMLKPGGKFYVHFGPPWLHPYGLHHFFMVRWPWMHLLWSEKRFMRLRPLFRPHENNEGKTRWEDTGCNKMTIRRFENLTRASGFKIESMTLHKVGGAPGFLAKLFREYLTSHVVAVLVKPG